MHSFFFGSSNRKLYGSVESGTGKVGVLICGSWGSEEQASHRFLGVLRRRLAAAGYTTMRFDYYGSGDSHGGQRELTLDTMLSDTLCALDELRDVADLRSLRLIGYRLGAVPALSVARRVGLPVVLVDPVLEGRAWLGALMSHIPAGELADGSLESGGFTLGKALRDALKSSPTLVDPVDGPEVSSVLFSQPDVGEGFCSKKVEICDSEPAWELHGGVGRAAVPHRLIDTLVERIRDLDSAVL